MEQNKEKKKPIDTEKLKGQGVFSAKKLKVVKG